VEENESTASTRILLFDAPIPCSFKALTFFLITSRYGLAMTVTSTLIPLSGAAVIVMVMVMGGRDSNGQTLRATQVFKRQAGRPCSWFRTKPTMTILHSTKKSLRYTIKSLYMSLSSRDYVLCVSCMLLVCIVLRTCWIDKSVSVLVDQSVSTVPHKKRLLIGIMSMESDDESMYREQFRSLFRIMKRNKDNRVCSIHDFEEDLEIREACELVYTFALGYDRAETEEVVDETRSVLASHATQISDDITVLNIRENVNQGKSQTWLYYAQSLQRKYNFDYIAKADSDSVWDVPKLLNFLQSNHVPPAPFNTGIIVGRPLDKLWWHHWKQGPEDYEHNLRERKEGFFMENYGRVTGKRFIFHLYAQGGFYWLSPDLVDVVIEEASSGRHNGYIEGNEDHDISTMAFHTETPVHFIMLSQMEYLFYHHPVKLRNRERWETKWEEAKERLILAYA